MTSISISRLTSRRKALGMSFTALSARSGVSVPTVQRILGGHLEVASFANVAAIADALGAPLGLVETNTDELRGKQARKKALQIARLVQGTSGLESQAVDAETYDHLVERSVHELLAGPKRRLWSD